MRGSGRLRRHGFGGESDDREQVEAVVVVGVEKEDSVMVKDEEENVVEDEAIG